MKTDTAQAVYLKDYCAPDYLISTVHLDVKLAPAATHVTSTLTIQPNGNIGKNYRPLILDGEEIKLDSLCLNGEVLGSDDYIVDENSLIIATVPQEEFTVEIKTTCNPAANTALSGLYRSSKTYCTQCEAEGFRRITYFPDRPDVLAVFTVRIEGSTVETPVLLSNGNPVESGKLNANRHFAIWHDPHPKPSYLFALVAGNLGVVSDHFTTQSGGDIELKIFVEPGNEDRCDYAMGALKRSMKWDEERFAREYDLDIFMIVAVSDFNMGAMENKGLNIFNDKFILARPDTATDADYANIESIIAHEYFHNWTGNRITCRDWFQLCLKEGLTVFRDQEFSADMRSRTVERIADVKRLRAQQFPEDAGPLAHPVQPESYIEINNFYTATVYEKGAELVRMLLTLLGPDTFRKAMDLYFLRHDGEAATVEDFIRVMEDAGGIDLTQFRIWYQQAGTPELTVNGRYDRHRRTYTLAVSQHCAPSPGQLRKHPYHIPLRIGLVDKCGEDMKLELDGKPAGDDLVLNIREHEHRFCFTNVAHRPYASILRSFSAPVKLTTNATRSDLLFLMQHDSDLFNRWECAQTYATRLLTDATVSGELNEVKSAVFGQALGKLFDDETLEPAFIAQMLTLPGESDLAREMINNVDPSAIYRSRLGLRKNIAANLKENFRHILKTVRLSGAYSPDAIDAGKRSLRNSALGFLAVLEDTSTLDLLKQQYMNADNMTDVMAVLSILTQTDLPLRDELLDDFYSRWKHDHLVVDKWLMLNALAPFEATVGHVAGLMNHPAFSLKNLNKVRALIGTFASANPVAFNHPSGAGYDLVSDTILKLDKINPQVAARLTGVFKSWRALESGRRDKSQLALQRLVDSENLSRDTLEIAVKSLD